MPLNSALLEALRHKAEWYHYAPASAAGNPTGTCYRCGRAKHLDPTRPITTIKTAWANAKEDSI